MIELPLTIIFLIILALFGWFRILDWLEKRTKKEAAQRAEEYRSCTQ